METTDLIIPLATLPTLSDAELGLIIEDAENVQLWVKLTPGGFLLNEETFGEIVGVITYVDRYWCEWVDNKPTKIREKDSPGSEFEIRADITVQTQSNQILGISLAKSSYLYNLSPYIKGLQSQNLKLTDVITSITVDEISGQFENFCVARFHRVGDIPAPVNIAQDTVDIQAISDDDIPF
jgi:hypothetical protein